MRAMRSALTNSSAQPLRRRQPVDTRAARRSAARIVASKPSSTSILLEDGRGLAQRLRVPYDNVFEVGLHGSQGCCRALGLPQRCEAHGLQHEGAGAGIYCALVGSLSERVFYSSSAAHRWRAVSMGWFGASAPIGLPAASMCGLPFAPSVRVSLSYGFVTPSPRSPRKPSYDVSACKRLCVRAQTPSQAPCAACRKEAKSAWSPGRTRPLMALRTSAPKVTDRRFSSTMASLFATIET